MVRRVKAYLKNMQVITNEDELHKMSLECEPPSGGVPHPPAATVLSTVMNMIRITSTLNNSSPILYTCYVIPKIVTMECQ